MKEKERRRGDGREKEMKERTNEKKQRRKGKKR
jgi:hypothetical protein